MPTIEVKECHSARDGKFDVVVSIDGAAPVSLRVADDAELDRQVLALSAPKTITVGVRDVVATTPVVKPPTQDELDQEVFVLLLGDWRSKKSTLGISAVVTQQDVDAAYATMKAAYKEEYASLLVGLV